MKAMIKTIEKWNKTMKWNEQIFNGVACNVSNNESVSAERRYWKFC